MKCLVLIPPNGWRLARFMGENCIDVCKFVLGYVKCALVYYIFWTYLNLNYCPLGSGLGRPLDVIKFSALGRCVSGSHVFSRVSYPFVLWVLTNLSHHLSYRMLNKKK